MGIKQKHNDGQKIDGPAQWIADPPVVVKRSPGPNVRVGTVALSHDDIAPDVVREIDLGQLGEFVGAVGSTQADVVLFCGVRVVDAATKDWNPAGRAAATALGCPFLIECTDDEPNEWWLVTSGKGFERMVRSTQFVVEAEDVDPCCHLVLAEFGAGLGRVTVRGQDGIDLRQLLLLICGEVRMLSRSPERLFQEQVLDWEFGLPKVFAGVNNVLLHPAHRPYAKPIAMTGWNLVGSWTDKGGTARAPTLGVAVTTGTRIDGAHPFRAVIHAGPFQRGNSWDEAVATLAFAAAPQGGHASLPAALERSGHSADGVIEVRYAEFTV